MFVRSCRLRPALCESLHSLRDYLALRWNLDKSSLIFYNSQAMDSSLLSHHHNSTSHTTHSHMTHKPIITDTEEITNSPKHISTASSELKANTEISKENISEESSSREIEVECMENTDKVLCGKEENSGEDDRDTWRDCVKSSLVKPDSTWKELLVEVSKICLATLTYSLHFILGHLQVHPALL